MANEYTWKCPGCGRTYELRKRVTITRRHCTYCNQEITTEGIDAQARTSDGESAVGLFLLGLIALASLAWLVKNHPWVVLAVVAVLAAAFFVPVLWAAREHAARRKTDAERRKASIELARTEQRKARAAKSVDQKRYQDQCRELERQWRQSNDSLTDESD